LKERATQNRERLRAGMTVFWQTCRGLGVLTPALHRKSRQGKMPIGGQDSLFRFAVKIKPSDILP